MSPAGGRYSRRPFPPYAYVPGRDPHPTRDPAGHSFGHAPRRAETGFDPGAWPTHADFLYGIDLFNHGYFWEAHEALEELWVAAGRRTPAGTFLQGLIQVAVALLKWSQGQHDGARRLAEAGSAKLGQAPAFGVDPLRLRADLEAWFAGRRARPPRITLAPPAALESAHTDPIFAGNRATQGLDPGRSAK